MRLIGTWLSLCLLGMFLPQAKTRPAVIGLFSEKEEPNVIFIVIRPAKDPIYDEVNGAFIVPSIFGNETIKFSGHYDRKKEQLSCVFAKRINGEVLYFKVGGVYDRKSNAFLIAIDTPNDDFFEFEARYERKTAIDTLNPLNPRRPPDKIPAKPARPLNSRPIAKALPKAAKPINSKTIEKPVRADPNVWGLVEVELDPRKLAGTSTDGTVKVDVAPHHYRRSVKDYLDAEKTKINNDYTLDVRFEPLPQTIKQGAVYKLTILATCMKNAMTYYESTFGVYRCWGHLEEKLISAGKGSPEGDWKDPFVGNSGDGRPFEPTASGVYQITAPKRIYADRFGIDEFAFGCIVARYWYEKGKRPIKVPD